MSNVKCKISLSFVMLLVLIMTLGSVVLAAEKIYVAVDLTVKTSEGTTLKNGEEISVQPGDKLYVTASCDDEIAVKWSTNPNFMSDKGFKFNNEGMALLSYMFDSTDKTQYKHSSDPTELAITIPNFEKGSEHYVVINAVAACDGLPVGDKEYQATSGTFAIRFTIGSEEKADPTDDELIVESWMKEDKKMEELAVSLRHDSEEYDKGNKNFYALGEEIVYYVDYKNGGDDITKEVKLVLELPLDFKVIDAFGGKVDSEERTITWTFPEGLEEDQSGTKVVKVAYTNFERASKKYEIVYPVADILERNKTVDSSAVINYIFRDEETEITDEHYPYMFGDANKDTFRPDDTITRAEGALVLTRIFGIDTSGTKVEPVFSDLGETYVEAQKAIVAATKLGLINGYEDGTYKPRKEMTRAEFMKIIASYIELNAEDEDIRGLEVKEGTNIKIYKDSKSLYMTGTTTVSTHWASNWVTMLVRLNMTPVSSSNKSIDLDAKITRAEVAQLVNFYLLRAPADVDSSTKTQFSDVSKRHDLFEDIVEATRPEHTYTLTKEGYEVEVDED